MAAAESSSSPVTRAERFAGLSVAIVTPFKDGKVDEPRLREQIDFQALRTRLPSRVLIGRPG